MGRKIFLLNILLMLITSLCFGRNEIGVKTFIPGATQLSNGETLKGWSIIGGEVLTLTAGAVSWYWSEAEYNKYKALPKTASQEEFDKHINDSEFYGTVAIGSFALFGATYLYSVIDAIWVSKGANSTGKVEPQQEERKYHYRRQPKKRYGFNLVPKKEGANLSAVIKF